MFLISRVNVRASDTPTRSFAHYKFVAYLLTYLLTYEYLLTLNKDNEQTKEIVH